MPDVFITLKEAAEFEGITYKGMTSRVSRNPKQYKTRTQPQENGGKEQVLVSVDSLTAKGRKAWRAAQKIDGRDVVIEKRAESTPWYVGVDLNHYTEQHKKEFYEAVELARCIPDTPLWRFWPATRFFRTASLRLPLRCSGFGRPPRCILWSEAF